MGAIRNFVDATARAGVALRALVAGNIAQAFSASTLRVNTGMAVGGATPGAGGIAFPGTAVAMVEANTLDDYEEGTFTPAVIGTTTSGAGTYTYQLGKYTKIGNRYDFKISLSWSAHTGTGLLRISGLPFTSANDAMIAGGNIAFIANIALVANNAAFVLTFDNSAQAGLYQYPVGGGAASAVDIDTAGILEFSGTVFV